MTYISYIMLISLMLSGCSIQLGIPPSINFGPPIPIGPQSKTINDAAIAATDAQTIDK